MDKEEVIEISERIERKTVYQNDTQCDKDQIGEYIGYTFGIFTIIWTFIILFNSLFSPIIAPILIIPYVIMGIGFLNKNSIADDKLEDGIFSTTFITMGLVFSIPLIGHINSKLESNCEKCKFLCHIVFLAMILTLLSYLHIWVDEKWRHVFKIVRSCFETMAVTLYILVLTYLFLLT